MADISDLLASIRKTRGDGPPPSVGASVTVVGDAIFVFGGRPVDSREMTNALYRLDLHRFTWERLAPSGPSPRARYFHAASTWGDKLVIHGGQARAEEGPEASQGDALEVLDSLSVYDPVANAWTAPIPTVAAGATCPPARFAHLAVTSTVHTPAAVGDPSTSSIPASETSSRLLVIGGQDESNAYLMDVAVLDLDRMEWVANGPYASKISAYRCCAASTSKNVFPAEEKLLWNGSRVLFSPHAEDPTDESEGPAYIINHRREVDVFGGLHSRTTPRYATRLSSEVTAPSLRFPSLATCGDRLVLSGVHVEEDRAQYIVYSSRNSPATPAWRRLSVESLSRGSWSQGASWRDHLVVLGSSDRDMSSDYRSRQTNFEHVAVIDLAGFGIFTPPARTLTAVQQQLALQQAGQVALHDIAVTGSDGQQATCSRRLLTARWPWLAAALDALPSAVPDRQAAGPTRVPAGNGAAFLLDMQTLQLPLRSPALEALVLYVYTASFLTPLQRSVEALGPLLEFGFAYPRVLPDLHAHVSQALHELLDDHAEDVIVVAQVLEAATLGGSSALQVRASLAMAQTERRSSTTSSLSLPYLRPPSSLSSGRVSPASHLSLEAMRMHLRTSAPPQGSLPPTPSTSSLGSEEMQARHLQSPLTSISSSTPEHIAKAWREAEERDQIQRLDALRIAVEADIAKSAAALRLAQEQKHLAERNATASPRLGTATAFSSDETASIRTSNSGRSDSTRLSAEKPAVAAAAAARAVKKGFFSSLVSGPTIHNAGVARPKTAGPAPKRMYPAPTPRTAKGSSALNARQAGSSIASSASSCRS